MESQSQGYEINSQDELFDIGPLKPRGFKQLSLSNEAEYQIQNLMNKRKKNIQLNRNLDPQNTRLRYPLFLKTEQFGQFQHFLTKNKYRDEKVEVFDVLRQLAQIRNIQLNGRIKDRHQKSRMIVRVINKQQTNGFVIIEDQTGKQKMQVKIGTIWVGMICCMDLSWIDGCYKLQFVHDLSEKIQGIGKTSLVKSPMTAYRMIFLKGSFNKLNSKESMQSIGIGILINELKALQQNQRLQIDCIVIFGPLLNSKNTALKNDFSQLTYQQRTRQIFKLIKDQINKISDRISVVFVPSTQDLVNYYPIPQPKYQPNLYKDIQADNFYYTSNPGVIQLSQNQQKYKINLINYDILEYIDENRVGKSINQIMQDNLQSYFKQPFYLTNTLNESFDQTNFPGLYNKGQFGNIVVTTSNRDPPYARQIKGRIFVNIGSLGIDEQNLTDKHYLTLLSIYDGEGPVSQRVKVQSISMSL